MRQKRQMPACLLNTFAKSLDTDQVRQNVVYDLDPTIWHSENISEICL